tara:strand:+ start:1259 stop:1366 length:108 start_codon:yes stop_codon:yes gene_type:complete
MIKNVLIAMAFIVWWYIFFHMFAQYPAIFWLAGGA